MGLYLCKELYQAESCQKNGNHTRYFKQEKFLGGFAQIYGTKQETVS